MDSTLALTLLHSAGFTQLELKNIFGKTTADPADIWHALERSGEFPHEISKKRQESIRKKLPAINKENIHLLLTEKNIAVIDQKNPVYPPSLKEVTHAPYFFYLRGILQADIPLIAVVGSRRNSPYAKRVLQYILPEIIRSGIGIVSGGALGVDTIGHEIALEHHGYTVAVMGTGIDRAYPAENRSLYERIIAAGGAVISHFPITTGAEPYNFPMRNEIVVGCVSGVLIPEAELSSGTLITAQLGLEYGRNIYAIAGDIDRKQSEGTNMLIATGQAKCTRSAADVLEDVFELQGVSQDGFHPIIREKQNFEDKTDQNIYELLQIHPQSTDEIVEALDGTRDDIIMRLSLLEISGYIELDMFGRYRVR